MHAGRGNESASRPIPPAPPSHGTFLAWYRGCRCEACQTANEEFRRELTLRSLGRRGPGDATGPRLSADDLAHIDPAVRTRSCPRCGALRYHRCRNLLVPAHYAATHAERSAPVTP